MRKKPSNNAICPLFMRIVIVFFNTNGTCIILIISVCMLRVCIQTKILYSNRLHITVCNACDCAPKMMAFKPETQKLLDSLRV